MNDLLHHSKRYVTFMWILQLPSSREFKLRLYENWFKFSLPSHDKWALSVTNVVVKSAPYVLNLLMDLYIYMGHKNTKCVGKASAKYLFLNLLVPKRIPWSFLKRRIKKGNFLNFL